MRRANALNEAVAGEIRAALARRRWPAGELARRLGENEMWLSRRLRGSQPMTLSDIERIADTLAMSPSELIASAVRMAAQTTVAKVSVAERLKDGRPKGREGARPKGRGDRHGPKSAVEQEIRRPTWRTNPGDVSQQRNAA